MALSQVEVVRRLVLSRKGGSSGSSVNSVSCNGLFYALIGQSRREVGPRLT